ncbi:hypothetical protein ACRAWG_39345 (plasmid) [Methylobacterium sp. P31]
MGENIEHEVRCLVRQVSEQAAQGGGLDRLTYDTLTAASAALSIVARGGGHEGREEALRAMRMRLRACEAGNHVKAA